MNELKILSNKYHALTSTIYSFNKVTTLRLSVVHVSKIDTVPGMSRNYDIRFNLFTIPERRLFSRDLYYCFNSYFIFILYTYVFIISLVLYFSFFMFLEV